jgi:hypothetical protein
MASHVQHPDLPIISAMFAIFAVVSDISAYPSMTSISHYDADFFAPFAHIAAGISGTIAAILGILAFYEKYIKKR